jgi:hypothetical protein
MMQRPKLPVAILAIALLLGLAGADTFTSSPYYSPTFEGIGFISSAGSSTASSRIPSWSAGLGDLRGSPSISAGQISSILAQAGSPAASEPGFSQCLYQGGQTYGIDPAYALAFFDQESGFGSAGVAATTKSLGNIKGTGPAGSYKGFRQYSSYCQGANDWYQLISSSSYYFRAGRYTVSQIVPVYSPSSDGNSPTQYISTVNSLVSNWRGQSGQYAS